MLVKGPLLQTSRDRKSAFLLFLRGNVHLLYDIYKRFETVTLRRFFNVFYNNNYHLPFCINDGTNRAKNMKVITRTDRLSNCVLGERVSK